MSDRTLRIAVLFLGGVLLLQIGGCRALTAPADGAPDPAGLDVDDPNATEETSRFGEILPGYGPLDAKKKNLATMEQGVQ